MTDRVDATVSVTIGQATCEGCLSIVVTTITYLEMALLPFAWLVRTFSGFSVQLSGARAPTTTTDRNVSMRLTAAAVGFVASGGVA